MGNSWFNYGRSEGFPTNYPPQHTSADTDVLTSGFILAFIIIGFSLIITLPAFSKSKGFALFIQIIISLFIGCSILLGNYGANWETGDLDIKSPYKPGFPDEVVGHIGLSISLRGINITLRGKPHSTASSSYMRKEIIDYNEHFSWEWAQGRFGFGPYAGRISQDFRAGVLKGLPLPILSLAEYFTFDGEGIRFGRHYRLSGWYCHILMWAAFATWILANIYFFMIVSHGAISLIVTGLLQAGALLFWTYNRNHVELQVPFELSKLRKSHDGLITREYFLRTHYGYDFYLVLFSCGLCISLGLLIYILNIMIPDWMCTFFGIDPLTMFTEHLLSPEEYEKETYEINKNNSDIRMPIPDIEMNTVSSQDIPEVEQSNHFVLRRTKGRSFFDKSFRVKKGKKPQPLPRTRHDKFESVEKESLSLLARHKDKDKIRGNRDQEKTYGYGTTSDSETENFDKYAIHRTYENQ